MPKQKSNASIGNQTVDRYITEVLMPEGWLSAKAGRTTQFGGEDFFGKPEGGPGFDILSLRRGQILLTQAKTGPSGSTFTTIKAWVEAHSVDIPPNVTVRLVELLKPTKTLPERWNVRNIINGAIG